MALSQRSNIILFVCIVTMLLIVYSRQGNNATSLTYSLSNGHKNTTTDDLHKSVIVQALKKNPTIDNNSDVKETQTLNKDGMSKSSQKDTDSSSPSSNSGVTPLKQSDSENETGKSEGVPRIVTDDVQAPQKSINVTTLGHAKSESIPTKQHSDATTYHQDVSTTTGGNTERFTSVITEIVTETTAEIITFTSNEEVNDDNIAVTQVDGTMTNNDVQELVTQIAAVEGTEVQQVTDEKVVTEIAAAEGTEVQQMTDATITDDNEVDRDVTIVTETVLITEVHETMTTINE
ncbi:uncharacterized protein [Apostichopus japonicus]|uniref:uncharacterized protein isoform X1 n=1 Tax=Stichopus japonicus TaxID=307972 RepID=UPI003AB66F5F